MFEKLKQAIDDFYIKESAPDIRLFKLLGTGGIIVSIIGAIQDIFTSSDLTGSLINLLAALASICLMWYVHSTGKYLVGYLLTTVSVFMFLFAWLFLETGGMNGSIPYFFAFGMVFTLLMYKGALRYIMTAVQTLFYVAVCWFSYKYPQFVVPFENEKKQFFDQMAGILFSAIGIGLIFLMYLWEYGKQQKLAEESSKAKSVLLANISHEIRTPINMLLGMNEMIMRESENTQINEYAQNVVNAGQQLMFMVNQFLDLSRIDMGKETLFEEDFNVLKTVESLGAFFAKEAEKKGLEFVLDIDGKVPEYVYGDNRKLSQILSNLLSNAVKYTQNGTIVLSVLPVENKAGENQKDHTIRFEVSDTGAGISGEDQQKIFESFERADIIRNRSIEGTGLGLAISNKLANLMGSDIKVKSQYGVGSVFWFDLQLNAGEESTDRGSVGGAFIAPEAKILIVDDNNMNLLVGKSLLKRTMISVDTAGSAQESYEKYAKTDYDLVFMDYMMPEVDGIEAMHHLKESDKAKNRHVPIIVLTADASSDKKEMFLSEGFDDYLLKPVDSRVMESILMKHLPARLITPVGGDIQNELPQELKKEFSALLKEYDISFELALKHLSGDVVQLARVSEFFMQNIGGSLSSAKKYVEAGDYENAAILFHAIKGNAGNVGAEDLYYSARRLERRAKDRDEEYVKAALPLFDMKAKRVEEGLRKFREKFESVKHIIIPEEEEENRPLDEQELFKKLLEEVRLGNKTPALRVVDKLAELKGNSKDFDAIRECIRSIEFDRAEELIGGLLNG